MSIQGTLHAAHPARWMVLGICWLMWAAIGTASATTVQIGAAKDTTIFQSGVNNSAGGQTQFYSGTNSVLSPRRSLIKFDIGSKVPSGAIITSVELQLFLSMVGGGGMGGGSGSPTIGLHEIGAEWGEGTVSSGGGNGNTANPGDATWSARMNGSALWTSPGGDFDSTASASLTIVGNNWNGLHLVAHFGPC